MAEGLPKSEGPGPLDSRSAAAPGPAEALDRQGLPHLLLAGWLHLPHCLPYCCAPGGCVCACMYVCVCVCVCMQAPVSACVGGVQWLCAVVLSRLNTYPCALLSDVMASK